MAVRFLRCAPAVCPRRARARYGESIQNGHGYHPVMGLKMISSGSGNPIKGLDPYRGTAYHYTNAEGALSILSNRVLWATAASMLNDSSEMLYGIEQLRAAHESWGVPEGSDLGGVLALQAAISRLDTDVVLGRTFVVSASTTEQSLNQWAHYANGSGYALGFRTDEALVQERATATAIERRDENENEDGMRPIGSLGVWHKVEYDPVRQEMIAHSAFDHIAALPTEAARAPRILANVLALMKHPTFAVEQEVRMVVWQDENTRVRFRTRGAYIVPYVQLTGGDPWMQQTGIDEQEATAATWHPSFYAERDGEHKPDPTELPLASVFTGPPTGEDAERRTATLEALVRSLGYSASVGHVPIPLR